MKFPNWFKISWWILLLLISGFILYKRSDAIFNGNAISIDVVIFLVFIALMLVPVFSEIDLLGIKLKQEIEDLKEYINIKVGDIKNELHSNHVQSIHIQGLGTPSPESKLPDIESKIKESITPELNNSNITFDNVPDDNILMFKVRYGIETQLRRIWENHYQEQNKPTPMMEIIHDLMNVKLLNRDIYNPLREILAICNYAIHGKEVSENQVVFVRNNANEIISYLKQL